MPSSGAWWSRQSTGVKAGVAVVGVGGAYLVYKRFKANASAATTTTPITGTGGCPSGYMDDGTGTGNCIPVGAAASGGGGSYGGGGGGGGGGLGSQILSALNGISSQLGSTPTTTSASPSSTPFGGLQTGPNGTAWYGGPVAPGAPYGTDINGTPLTGPNYTATNPTTPGNGTGSAPTTSAGTGSQPVNAAAAKAALAAQPSGLTGAARHQQEVANRTLRQEAKK